MFDVSFSELFVIAVVALIVIGPEKLPKVARTLGAIAGRMQRYVAQVKEEVNREVRFEELQALQSEIKMGVDKSQKKMQLEMEKVVSDVTLNQQAADEETARLTPNLTPVENHPASISKELPEKAVKIRVRKPAVKSS